ncbi:patatin-like phospholipase domain-containing protein 2 [Lates calcarifer]|uniref:triacylglycerol lipase n=1 Tax=Lates calcarifer TaxID=8187 RepID=A0A4W6FYZ6_LATCA|nr:patatin-like phospholipase domain-containing protein 2 [Lates calcarifer]
MFDLKKEWSISFAGCGFMGIYYVGATSCILEQFPRFIQDASKIYGASAGALMAAILAVGIPLEKCCASLMFMAKEARKHKLGPLHPAYNLLQIVKDSLLGSLPEDAHVRASGKLCVSLTRVSDGKNVLVSEFDSREELIQALVCSCFVPFYCGVIPPTYRGVHYVDGAVSDNLPRCHLKNTVTFSAYAGESDICPRASTLNFHEVRFNNVSIQVNSENMYRVASTFFPPEPEAMSEICQYGYIDALRFLQENNLISGECPLRSLETDSPRPVCCELAEEQARAEESNKNTQQNGLKPPQREHFWLNPQLIENLPVNIRKVLCEACRESHTADSLLSHMAEYLPKKVTSYLQFPRTLPVESAYSLAHKLVDWIPDVPKDMSWLYGMAEDIYRQAWRDKVEDHDRESPLRRCASVPLGLNLCNNRKKDVNSLPMTPEASPTSSLTYTWNTNSEEDHMPLTPPPTPSLSPTYSPVFGEATMESPQSAGWGLGRAVGWIRNIAFEQTSNNKEKDDS